MISGISLEPLSYTCQYQHPATLFIPCCLNLQTLSSFVGCSICKHVELNWGFICVCHKIKRVAVCSSLYGGPQVPRQKQKLSRHKQNSQGTNKNSMTQTKTLTAQTKTPRHKQNFHSGNHASQQSCRKRIFQRWGVTQLFAIWWKLNLMMTLRQRNATQSRTAKKA